MSARTSTGTRQLHCLRQLARLYGVQTAFHDAFGQRQEASPESLLAVLCALSVPVVNLDHVSAALRERQQQVWKRVLEPVIVAWDGVPPKIELRLQARRAQGKISCRVQLETGEEQSWVCGLDQTPLHKSAHFGKAEYVSKIISLPAKLPSGYHRLRIELGGDYFESLLLIAPQRVFTELSKTWGLFLPLYALRSRKSWGGGDFSDLEVLADWVKKLGGGVVSTLPFLASFLREFFDASPYSPASRLFWNEFYVDPRRAEEFSRCQAARKLVESAEFQREIEELRSAPQIDYCRQMALKRRVLEEMAQWLVQEKSDRYTAFRRFVDFHPSVEDYAQFRAVVERRQTPWTEWPEPLRSGVLKQQDYDEDARLYHLYAQWLAEEQVNSLAARARDSGPRLYLDLPLGVHGHGYDVWRHREVFAVDASGGAPPDAVFTSGQNWGFPPLHPEKIREQRYGYLIACLRHQLAHAGLLRIDHVMGLHRLFWIPKGLKNREGVYVRYRAEEFYAIVSLESHRHQALVVGENLGTVPNYVNTAMGRHGMQKMYVVEYEIKPDTATPLRPPPRVSVASLNTHDMPPFAAFLTGQDIEDRLQLGLLKEIEAPREWENRRKLREALVMYFSEKGLGPGREEDLKQLLRNALEWLGRGPAKLVLVNLEDLWLETEPQNVPGISGERPNWRRKARYSWEEFQSMAQVVEVLQNLRDLREGRGRTLP